MPKVKGLTKKEIKRFSKATLIKMCKENSMDCNKKDSKNSLVDKIFKNRKLRSTLKAPPKRKQSEKQKANSARLTQRLKIGKDFKNETKIKQPAQYVAEVRKIEDTAKIGRGEKNEEMGKKTIGQGKGLFVETQVEKLKDQANENANVEKVRRKELKKSTNKTSDLLDRAVDGQLQNVLDSKRGQAIVQAKSTKDLRFGDPESPEEAQQSNELRSLPNDDLGTRLRKLMKDKPDDPTSIILRQLAIEAKKKNSKN